VTPPLRSAEVDLIQGDALLLSQGGREGEREREKLVIPGFFLKYHNME